MNTTLTKQPSKKSSGQAAVHHSRVIWSAKKADGDWVIGWVHGLSGKSGATAPAPSQLIQAIQFGLPFRELDALQASLNVPMERLVPMLGISKATLHRRKASGKLAPAESDRVVRFARLLGKAVEVLESAENARQWLTSPQFGLGGAVPLDYAETEVGAREVEDLLGRIEYGVYS
jgi:putative toxin-antitoxin system antitoxin component (TIGR02293 family)